MRLGHAPRHGTDRRIRRQRRARHPQRPETLMPSAAPAPERTAILLLSCPDRKGLMATVADFIYGHNANIVHFDQHRDLETNLLIMRVEWDLTGFDLELSEFRRQFSAI